MGNVEAELRAIRVEIEKVLKSLDRQAVKPIALSMEEAAESVSLGDTKFAQLVKRGEIATFRVERRRLVRVQELEDWAQRQTLPVPVRIPKTRRKTEGDKVRAALKKR